ncbi:MAG: hypothetical protein GX864_01250 [Mollicutes bacterium]|jgi:hypothetical protein|nr:hypothetical protein [Mollicutes bacterium]
MKTINKKGKADQQYSETWVPIKEIANGMIKLDNDFFVTGVKIEPKNIFIMDIDSENNVIMNFRNLYNTIDFEFWLIIADRPVDIGVYISQLQVEMGKQQNPAIRKLIIQDIQKAEAFMGPQYNVVDTEYYFLFREKKPEIIQKRLSSLMTGLANCGMNSVQTSNEDLRMIIDNFYNGNSGVEFGVVMPQ